MDKARYLTVRNDAGKTTVLDGTEAATLENGTYRGIISTRGARHLAAQWQKHANPGACSAIDVFVILAPPGTLDESAANETEPGWRLEDNFTFQTGDPPVPDLPTDTVKASSKILSWELPGASNVLVKFQVTAPFTRFAFTYEVL